MTFWWIVDCRHTEPWNDFQGWPSWFRDKVDAQRKSGLSASRPRHLLLLGCCPQTAIGIRKQCAQRGFDITVHALPAPYLDAFAGAPEKWLELCLNRLLTVNGAESVEIFPDQKTGEGKLSPRKLLAGPAKPPLVPEKGKKPSLAFVSPLPPSQTGIASYSLELLGSLSQYYDLTLVVESARPKLPGHLKGLPWMTAAGFRRNAASFERIVYQVGNSLFHAWQFDLVKCYPGLVVLHDFYLYDAVWWQEKAGLKPGALRYSLYEHHGYAAVLELDAAKEGRGPENYPVNADIVLEAAGIIVHSQHALDLYRQWYPECPGDAVSIVAHPRRLPEKIDRQAARKRLGIKDKSMVIASFGGMNSKKGGDRIIEAFFNADFERPREMLLVFAGSEHDGPYGSKVRRMIASHPRGKQVMITGYLSPEEYQAWLQAADMAVQLRKQSRGESSGAVLDAMSYGLPLIANAHGSNAELPDHAVCLLPEDPDAVMLQEAMEEMAASHDMRCRLGRKAQDWVRQHHCPDTAAGLYRRAIEKNADHPVMLQKQWLDTLTACKGARDLSRPRLKSISRSMQQLQLLYQKREPRILIDVTILAWHDQKTGIERVTREIAIQLLKNPPKGYRSELIRWQGDDFYLALDCAAGLLNLSDAPGPNRPAEASADDIYLSLEWAPPLLQQAYDAFLQMKAIGVRFCFTVHDLLPLFLPRCFPEGTEEKMRDWFHRIAYLADGIVCVSAHVAETVADQLQRLSLENPPGVAWFHPGADFSLPQDDALTIGEKQWLNKIDVSPKPKLLMVGTLEPRKGHQQVLDAVECLWGRQVPVTLICAGKTGKGVEMLAARLKKHPQNGQQLFWCHQPGDALLAHLYKCSDVLVAASIGEGFGLPLIEAAHHRLPILARDIPVFREVAGSYARYFSAPEGKALADDIEAWINDWREGNAQPSCRLSCNNWADSASQLQKALFQSISSLTC